MTNDITPDQQRQLIEHGRSLGVSAQTAINEFYIRDDGSIGMSAKFMAGYVRKAGYILEQIRLGAIPRGDYTATAILSLDGTVLAEATWDPHRAARAGKIVSYGYAMETLGEYSRRVEGWEVRVSNPEDSYDAAWLHNPEDQCMLRAISEVITFGAAEVFFGEPNSDHAEHISAPTWAVDVPVPDEPLVSDSSDPATAEVDAELAGINGTMTVRYSDAEPPAESDAVHVSYVDPVEQTRRDLEALRARTNSEPIDIPDDPEVNADAFQ